MSKAKIKYSRIEESVTGVGWSYEGAEGTPGVRGGTGQRSPALRDKVAGRDDSSRRAPHPGRARGELCGMAKTQPRRAESICRPKDSNWGEMKSQRQQPGWTLRFRKISSSSVLAAAWNRDGTHYLIFCVLRQSKSTGSQWCLL